MSEPLLNHKRKFDDEEEEDDDDDDDVSRSRTNSFGHEDDFASKIEQLDSNYIKKMYEVESWYRSEWHRAHGHAAEDDEVQRFFVSANQFSFRNGNSASSAISLLGVWDFLKKDTRDPEEMSWKLVIKVGCNLWETWKEEHFREKHHFPEVKEILELPKSDAIKKDFKLEREIYGRLHDEPLENDPEDVLSDIVVAMQVQGRCAGTFTARQTTISFYRNAKREDKPLSSDNEVFWIFDSHGGDKPGSSTLLKITNSAKFIAFLLQKFVPIYNMYGSPPDVNNFLFLLFVPDEAQRRKDVQQREKRNVSTLRGSGHNQHFALLEEMGHMDGAVYRVVVAPTLLQGSGFIGITTLGEEEGNFVDELLSYKNDKGEPLINSIIMRQSCDNCIRLGIEADCEHLMGHLPYWHERKRHREVQMMLAGQQDVFLREVKGIQVDMYRSPAFSKATVNKLADPDRVFTNTSFRKHVFVSLDPAGGGEGSKYAITSCIYDRHQMVILGGESNQSKDPFTQIELLTNHIDALKKFPGCEAAYIILIIESNLWYAGMWTEHELYRSGVMRRNDVCVMFEDDGRAGVKMQPRPGFKGGLVRALQEKLIEESVFFHNNFVCIGDKNSPEEMKSEIVKQLHNFTRHWVPSKDVHKPGQEIFNGKSGYGFDDHVMALIWNLVMKNRFYSNAKYGRWH